MDINLLDLFQHFIKKQDERSEIPIHGQVEGCLDYCQYIIRTQFDKNSKSRYRFKKRKGSVQEQFMKAFNTLSGKQKMQYYIKNVNYLVRINSGNYSSPKVQKGQLQTTLFTRSYNLKRWKKKTGRLDREKKQLYLEKDGSIKIYKLSEYIFRFSKNTDYFSFVLEAIYDQVIEKARTVHIGFKQSSEMKVWSQNIQLCIDYKHWQKILRQLKGVQKIQSIEFMESRAKTQILQNKVIMESKTKVKQNENESMKSEQKKQVKAFTSLQPAKLPLQQPSIMREPGEKSRTIIDSLMQSDNDEDIEEIQNKDKVNRESKKNLDLFHRMFPDYELQQLQEQNGFQMIFNDKNSRIIQSIKERKNYKIIIQAPPNIPKEIIFNALCIPQFQSSLLSNIQEIKTKTLISSENSAIIYQKNKPYNKLYRARDFVFIRHGFRRDNDIFIADRKIQNSNYPPFMTIVRGDYSSLWGILQKKNQIKIIGDISISHQGYLNEQQQKNLTLNFIKQYLNLLNFCKEKSSQLKSLKLFDLRWNISENKQNVKDNEERIKKNKQRKRLRQEEKKKLVEAKILPIEQIMEVSDQSVKKSKQEKKSYFEDQGEITMKELEQMYETAIQIERNFDDKGFVIIDKKFIKTKYPVSPIPVKKQLYLESPIGHPIWKGEWVVDKKQGGIIFIDEKKIQDQKGVLKFILTKIGKNILSGKSVLNISLPVDIFCPQSNLQRLLYSLCYGPKIIQKVVKKQAYERFKAVIAFGISNSPLYLNMQKPFNPILGQTFQCWINGCPAYAEQISHHPPIGALYFVGRGYRITAQLESKVELHMNSGCGINDGTYKVKFDDGEQMCFCLPGGEVSGLTYGDRKFNMVGKAYYWIEKSNYFVQLIYNPNKKGLFSIGKQENPSDYFEGTILEVKPEFLKSFEKKKRAPNENQILKKHDKVSGCWHKYLKFNDQIYVNFDDEFPFKLEYETNPLPSDANWRQDIAYRRIHEISRAQTQKQRLQVLQRQDRKLREKVKKK